MYLQNNMHQIRYIFIAIINWTSYLGSKAAHCPINNKSVISCFSDYSEMLNMLGAGAGLLLLAASLATVAGLSCIGCTSDPR